MLTWLLATASLYPQQVRRRYYGDTSGTLAGNISVSKQMSK